MVVKEREREKHVMLRLQLLHFCSFSTLSLIESWSRLFWATCAPFSRSNQCPYKVCIKNIARPLSIQLCKGTLLFPWKPQREKKNSMWKFIDRLAVDVRTRRVGGAGERRLGRDKKKKNKTRRQKYSSYWPITTHYNNPPI